LCVPATMLRRRPRGARHTRRARTLPHERASLHTPRPLMHARGGCAADSPADPARDESSVDRAAATTAARRAAAASSATSAAAASAAAAAASTSAAAPAVERVSAVAVSRRERASERGVQVAGVRVRWAARTLMSTWVGPPPDAEQVTPGPASVRLALGAPSLTLLAAAAIILFLTSREASVKPSPYISEPSSLLTSAMVTRALGASDCASSSSSESLMRAATCQDPVRTLSAEAVSGFFLR
jgi:pyruvate/2-oxoglutarate dehydrogenase complex dihydrolipoamide acyltransferase (E2) component